jgi:hypothetical protein
MNIRGGSMNTRVDVIVPVVCAVSDLAAVPALAATDGAATAAAAVTVVLSFVTIALLVRARSAQTA